ncbi:hypothetical protein Tco_0514759 [Tanacetum coccineum]
MRNIHGVKSKKANCLRESHLYVLPEYALRSSFVRICLCEYCICPVCLEYTLCLMCSDMFAMNHIRLVPSCFVIFDLEPLTLSLDFVLMYEIFKSLSFRLDYLCRLAILCLDQHAHTLHHLESLLTISLDRLDILKEDLVYQSLCGSLCL